MKLALMQPTFNPWLGYFDLIDYVDIFVFFDVVQLNQQSWQTRNKLKIQNKEFLFTIPIQKNKSKKELLIKDALIDFRKYDFRKKLAKTLKFNYKKAKYYYEVNGFIKDLIYYDTKYLSKYNINIIKKIVNKINFKTKIVILSETAYEIHQCKGDLVLDICKYFNASEYISPLGAKNYLDTVIHKFQANNIKVAYQYYQHPVYTQIGDNFVSNMGIFDLLYNEGFKKSGNIIISGRSYKYFGE